MIFFENGNTCNKTGTFKVEVPDHELRRNGEGYPDPTAYEAILRSEYGNDSDREMYHKLIGCILRICELSGYSVESRIVLKDKRTGKVWR